MSVRTKLLLSLFGFLTLAVSLSGVVGALGLADHAALAALSEKALTAGEASRSARDQFDRADQLITQVTGMTDFIDPSTIEARFSQASVAAGADLDRLRAASLSEEMTNLSFEAIESFKHWKTDASILLGLTPTPAIPTLEIMGRRSRTVRAVLNNAVALAASDATAQVAKAGSDLRSRFATLTMMAGILVAVAAAAAVWLARNLAHPLISLTANAKALAAGNVSVQLNALGRRDEIGELARAIDLFRDNVTAQAAAEQEASASRLSADAQRTLNLEEGRRAAAAQKAVVDALADGLSRLSDGDLTHRLPHPFAAEYESLRGDFNGALAHLQETLAVIAGNGQGIRSGSGEISQAADDLSRRTEQQAASLEETAAALDEITATVRRTAEGAKHANQVVAVARGDAETSGRVVQDTVAAMGAIERSSVEISQIIGVIDEIAFQTNLLALNAGVEAARAGEAGRGFAVVASEVRALAQRSAQAAKEIKGLISTSSKQVASGVTLVGETGKALARIAAQVSEISGIVTEISASAQEQAVGLQEVNTAVNQMDQMTQQNAAMVEQSTAASHSLRGEAEQLATLIGRFRTGHETGLPPSKGHSESTRIRLAKSAPFANTPARSAGPIVAGNLARKHVAVEETRKTF